MAKFLSQIYTLPQHRIYFAAGETDNKVKCTPQIEVMNVNASCDLLAGSGPAPVPAKSLKVINTYVDIIAD